jgi:eukaryotic-like serine/threonine-protein kinase
VNLVNQLLTDIRTSNQTSKTFLSLDDNTTQQQNIEQTQLQTEQTDSFLTYENSTYGIRLHYPSNWQNQLSLRPIFDVLFVPPEETEPLPRTGVGLKIFSIPSIVNALNQDPDNMYMAVENIAPAFLKSIIPDFLLTGSDRTTLAGKPAFNMRFIGYIGEGITAVQTTLLIDNGKLYVLTYFAPAQAFANHLLMANRMTNSFEILPSCTYSERGNEEGICI